MSRILTETNWVVLHPHKLWQHSESVVNRKGQWRAVLLRGLLNLLYFYRLLFAFGISHLSTGNSFLYILMIDLQQIVHIPFKGLRIYLLLESCLKGRLLRLDYSKGSINNQDIKTIVYVTNKFFYNCT